MQYDQNQSDYISRAGGGVSNPHGIRRARGTEQKRCASGIHSVVATKGENPLGLSYREVGQAVAETLTRRCYCEHDCWRALANQCATLWARDQWIVELRHYRNV